jgi:hypothetical protein
MEGPGGRGTDVGRVQVGEGEMGGGFRWERDRRGEGPGGRGGDAAGSR